jgi:hypothetical protein
MNLLLVDVFREALFKFLCYFQDLLFLATSESPTAFFLCIVQSCEEKSVQIMKVICSYEIKNFSDLIGKCEAVNN